MPFIEFNTCGANNNQKIYTQENVARPVGSDKYIVFNQHQLPSQSAHVQQCQIYEAEPIRGEIENVSAINK